MEIRVRRMDEMDKMLIREQYKWLRKEGFWTAYNLRFIVREKVTEGLSMEAKITCTRISIENGHRKDLKSTR